MAFCLAAVFSSCSSSRFSSSCRRFISVALSPSLPLGFTKCWSRRAIGASEPDGAGGRTAPVGSSGLSFCSPSRAASWSRGELERSAIGRGSPHVDPCPALGGGLERAAVTKDI
eukprot:scaffold37707_cov69-Phaeocystis_antarctica.AAC.4